VLALFIAAPLLSLWVEHGAAVLVGMVLLEATMPVTLLALYRAIPAEPGLAFGLAALALLAGAVPVFLLPAAWLIHPWLLLGLGLTSAAALWVVLPRMLRGEAGEA
jgi:hypothetical protein